MNKLSQRPIFLFWKVTSGRVSFWPSCLCPQPACFSRLPQTLSNGPQLRHWSPATWEAVDWPAVGNERPWQTCRHRTSLPNERLSRLTKNETHRLDFIQKVWKMQIKWSAAALNHIFETRTRAPPLASPSKCRTTSIPDLQTPARALLGRGARSAHDNLGSPALTGRLGLLFIYLDSAPTTGQEAPGFFVGATP